MPIISVGDKENNRWKRNGEKKQTNKDRKGQGDGGWGGGRGAEAIVKRLELNDFGVHLT